MASQVSVHIIALGIGLLRITLCVCVLDFECDSNTLSNDAQQLTTSIGSQWKQSTFLRFKKKITGDSIYELIFLS